MKNRKLVVFTALAVLVIAIAALVVIHHNNPLPSSFTATYTQDTTSSAAGRNFTAVVAFSNGRAISGTEKYDAGGGFGADNKPWETHDSCTLQNQQWVDPSGSPCRLAPTFLHNTTRADGSMMGETYEGRIPVTIDDMTSLIHSGDIVEKPAQECMHEQLCYQISK